jgi:hypothetical protein
MRKRFTILMVGLATLGFIAKASAAGAPAIDVRPVETIAQPSTTTTTTEAARIPLIVEGLLCPEWHDLAVEVGISIDDLPIVMAIIHRESRCLPGVINKTLNRDGSWDLGLSQVNDRSWCEKNRWNPIGYLQAQGIISTCEDLLDPEMNLRSMLALMNYSEVNAPCRFEPWKWCDRL